MGALKALRILRMVKLARMLRLSHFVRRLQSHWDINYQWLTLAKYMAACWGAPTHHLLELARAARKHAHQVAVAHAEEARAQRPQTAARRAHEQKVHVLAHKRVAVRRSPPLRRTATARALRSQSPPRATPAERPRVRRQPTLCSRCCSKSARATRNGAQPWVRVGCGAQRLSARADEVQRR